MAIRDVLIFDAHMHYRQAARDPYPVRTVIKLMDKSDVAMALISRTPDEGRIKLWKDASAHLMVDTDT